MKRFIKKTWETVTVLGVLFFTAPMQAAAQTYSTLIDSSLNNGGGLDGLLNNIFLLSISAAAIFAVIKIIIGGVKYMLTDVVTTKESAKKDIKGALLGLVIILAAVFILQTINPNLTKFQLQFSSPAATPFTNPFTGSGGGTSGGAVAASFPCAVHAGPNLSSSGATRIETMDVSGCNQTDADAALQQFSASCTKDSAARYSTSPNGTVGACAVPVQQSTTPIIEFDLESYGKVAWYDPKDEYMEVQGNVFVYDVVRQCGVEADTAAERDQCLQNISDALFETEVTSGFIGFCTNNGAKDFVKGPADYRCTLPTWKTKDDDFRDAYLSTLGPTQQSNWNLAAFTQMCSAEGGQIVDIETFRYTDIDDYRCVKY